MSFHTCFVTLLEIEPSNSHGSAKGLLLDVSLQMSGLNCGTNPQDLQGQRAQTDRKKNFIISYKILEEVFVVH